MNLEQAIEFTRQRLEEGFQSDGCTYSPDLGITHFCHMHDALLAYKPVTRLQADNLFFQGICTKGIRYYPVAVIYWVAVRAFTLFEK